MKQYSNGDIEIYLTIVYIILQMDVQNKTCTDHSPSLG